MGYVILKEVTQVHPWSKGETKRIERWYFKRFIGGSASWCAKDKGRAVLKDKVQAKRLKSEFANVKRWGASYSKLAVVKVKEAPNVKEVNIGPKRSDPLPEADERTHVRREPRRKRNVPASFTF